MARLAQDTADGHRLRGDKDGFQVFLRSERLGKMTHMDTLTLEIPREIAQALRLPPPLWVRQKLDSACEHW
jgi:hypothetical protein